MDIIYEAVGTESECLALFEQAKTYFDENGYRSAAYTNEKPDGKTAIRRMFVNFDEASIANIEAKDLIFVTDENRNAMIGELTETEFWQRVKATK